MHSRSLWRTDTTIFAKFNKPSLSNTSPQTYLKQIPPPGWGGGEVNRGLTVSADFPKFLGGASMMKFEFEGVRRELRLLGERG